MGSILSKFRAAPILNVPADATLEEVGREYRKQVYQNRDNPERIRELNCALEENKKTLKIKIYTTDYFAKDFSKRADDFFKRLCNACEIVGSPSFLSSDYASFYKYWGGFRHYDASFTNDVQRIVKTIKRLDGRMERIKLGCSSVSNPDRDAMGGGNRDVLWSGGGNGDLMSAKGQNKKEEEKAEYRRMFYCEDCNKAYISEKGLKNHKKSKKHLKRAVSGSDGIKLDSAKVEDNEIGVCGLRNDIDLDNDSQSSIDLGNVSEIKEISVPVGAPIGSDHEMFRTCSVCKKIFPDRKTMILHIRDSHHQHAPK